LKHEECKSDWLSEDCRYLADFFRRKINPDCQEIHVMDQDCICTATSVFKRG
jgi:hypothetical protein